MDGTGGKKPGAFDRLLCVCGWMEYTFISFRGDIFGGVEHYTVNLMVLQSMRFEFDLDDNVES